jgi:8-oxo-dGTP diphosphatase
MNEIDNRIRVVASVIVPYSGKFICVKTKKDGKWGLPGGSVEPFEDIRIAAPREVSEEVGIEVVLENIVAIQYHRSERQHPILNTTYSSKIIEGIPKIMEPDKIEGMEFLSLKEIRKFYQEGKLRSKIVTLRAVENYLTGVKYPLGIIEYFIENR